MRGQKKKEYQKVISAAEIIQVGRAKKHLLGGGEKSGWGAEEKDLLDSRRHGSPLLTFEDMSPMWINEGKRCKQRELQMEGPGLYDV